MQVRQLGQRLAVAKHTMRTTKGQLTFLRRKLQSLSKGKDDADFLATIVEAQAARAAASKAVLDKLQPTLGPHPSLLSPAVSALSDRPLLCSLRELPSEREL